MRRRRKRAKKSFRMVNSCMRLILRRCEEWAQGPSGEMKPVSKSKIETAGSSSCQRSVIELKNLVASGAVFCEPADGFRCNQQAMIGRSARSRPAGGVAALSAAEREITCCELALAARRSLRVPLSHRRQGRREATRPAMREPYGAR